MPHFAAFHLSLHCLPNPVYSGVLCIKRTNAYDSETSKRLRGYAGLLEPSLVALTLSIPVAPECVLWQTVKT